MSTCRATWVLLASGLRATNGRNLSSHGTSMNTLGVFSVFLNVYSSRRYSFGHCDAKLHSFLWSPCPHSTAPGSNRTSHKVIDRFNEWLPGNGNQWKPRSAAAKESILNFEEPWIHSISLVGYPPIYNNTIIVPNQRPFGPSAETPRWNPIIEVSGEHGCDLGWHRGFDYFS
jgi:hypothetical protein